MFFEYDQLTGYMWPFRRPTDVIPLTLSEAFFSNWSRWYQTSKFDEPIATHDIVITLGFRLSSLRFFHRQTFKPRTITPKAEKSHTLMYDNWAFSAAWKNCIRTFLYKYWDLIELRLTLLSVDVTLVHKSWPSSWTEGITPASSLCLPDLFFPQCRLEAMSIKETSRHFNVGKPFSMLS